MSALEPVNFDQSQVLRTLGINASDPNAQALLLVCQRYELDPLLKHMQLIKGTPYITRDGYLHVAHQSGVFAGMETVDEWETDTEFKAKVSVWRKDMPRPFTSIGRAKKNERSMADPVDMAVTRAERRALKRAFDVAGMPDPPHGDWDVDYSTGEANRDTEVEVVYSPPQIMPPLPVEPAAESGGGGGPSGGNAHAPTETSATRRTQTKAAAATAEQEAPTGADDHALSGPGSAGDDTSPASLDGSTVMVMFGRLTPAQRGVVRAKWATRGLTASDQPDECAHIIREVTGA